MHKRQLLAKRDRTLAGIREATRRGRLGRGRRSVVGESAAHRGVARRERSPPGARSSGSPGVGLGLELARARSSRALRPQGLGLELAGTGTGAHRGTEIGARFLAARFLEMRYSGGIGHRS